MRKEKEEVINGTMFKVTQLGFADGIELLTTLGRIIGPVLGDSNKDSGQKIGDILSRVTSKEVLSMTAKLAKSTRLEREPGLFPVLEPEVDLAGNYDLTLKWLKFALEANYGDFFAEGGLLRSAINTPSINPV